MQHQVLLVPLQTINTQTQKSIFTLPILNKSYTKIELNARYL